MEEQAELKKCSSDRLKLKLCDAGIDEQVVLAMDRTQLLNAAAEHKIKANVLLSASMAERELYLREQDLKLRQAEAVAREAAAQLQMQMREDDIRRETAAREAAAKLQMQMREDDIRREAAAREADIRREEARWNAELQFRDSEAQRQHEYRKQDREWRDKEREEGKSLLNQTKKFAQAIKDIFPSMPSDSAELPSYLNNVENLPSPLLASCRWTRCMIITVLSNVC